MRSNNMIQTKELQLQVGTKHLKAAITRPFIIKWANLLEQHHMEKWRPKVNINNSLE